MDVFTRWLTFSCSVSFLLTVTQLPASEPSAAIGPGATRAQLIEEYGPPQGGSKSGDAEILHFRTHQVRLRNGRVERISLKTLAAPATPAGPSGAAALTPASAPGASSGAVAKDSASALAAVWMTDFEHATRDALRRNSAILAVFTTSDASPSSRQFQQEVTLHPDFVNAFRGRYVLLHVDFPERIELPSELREQNDALRERYGVRDFPALFILSDTGEKVARVELSQALPGIAFRTRLIAAVTAAHPFPVVAAAPAAPPPEPEKARGIPPPSAQVFVAPTEVTSALVTARWLVGGALVIGFLIAASMLFIVWLALRKINKPVASTRVSTMASRIDHAASGLPSHEEIVAWPKDVLCTVMSKLAETEGYVAEGQPSHSDKDLVLKRPGDPAAEIVVCCATGNAGVIPTRKLREMVGMVAADDARGGWFIAPMGFSSDARTYAEQHNVRLIDATGLLERLSDLPTFALPKVLAIAK
jgi:hypothetical protein